MDRLILLSLFINIGKMCSNLTFLAMLILKLLIFVVPCLLISGGPISTIFRRCFSLVFNIYFNSLLIYFVCVNRGPSCSGSGIFACICWRKQLTLMGLRLYESFPLPRPRFLI